MYFFLFLLISYTNCFSTEIDQYALPNKPSELSMFSREKLRSYRRFYRKERKEGRVYCNAVIKSEFSLKKHRDNPKHHMLNFWFVHEMIKLEHRRRRHIEMSLNSLEEFLRDVNLIPEEIRKNIQFPIALPLETQYLMCQSPNLMKYALSEMPERIENMRKSETHCCNIWDILCCKLRHKEYI